MSTPPSRSRPDSPLEVWVVEDDPAGKEMLRQMLTSHGYGVSEFDSAEEAFHELEKQERLPALILLDLMLPGMSGMDMIRLMRENTQWKPIPVVVVTSMARQESRVGKEVGDKPWLRKPIDTNELMDTIKSFLKH